MNERFYLLKIHMLGIEPKIWRRFVVPANITLDRLHDVIQIVMGWTDSHLHEFTIGNKRYTEYPESKEDGLVCGIAQFQLVHIHPFLDGNGRTSRLLSTLCLYKAGYDFKRLFTISEYYDRDRPTFYKKIQSVRENYMDMTGWLDYFITGLETQMIEVNERGEQVIRRDILVQKHSLNERQAKALNLLMKNSSVHISEIQEHCSGVTRRTLQRDMNGLIELNLVRITGSARQSNYELIK